ncbi:MAG TPA: hypothetical protein ENK06_04470, partial [Gammaproteobacteria bacterium]|nr:hypothetical protein [Gammaproteobacteria bacterium]
MKDYIVVPLSGYNSTSRYKAEVRIVSPGSARQRFTQHNHCFVGISLDSPSFLGSKLQAIIDYVSKNFENCTFLLGDHVHRMTLRIRKNLDLEQCYYHALGLGDYYLRTQKHLLRHKDTGKAFPIIRGSDIHQLQEVKAYLE